MFDFKRERVNDNCTMQKNQLYVEYGVECPCNCSFCHNKVKAQNCKTVCLEKVDETVLQYAPYCKRIVFGGGEPLLQFDKILALVRKIKEQCSEPDNFVRFNELSEYNYIKCQIVTNGARDLYLKHLYNHNGVRQAIIGILLGEKRADEVAENAKCDICHMFDRIILSRHHYDDHANEAIFGAGVDLLRTSDMRGLCSGQKSKILLHCVCQSGGIDSREEIFNYIDWAIKLGFKDILFSDLDIHYTPQDVYSNKNISSNLFQSVLDMFVMWHTGRMPYVVYNSSGYRTTTVSIPIGLFIGGEHVMDDEAVNISFKEYMDISGGNRRYYNYNNEKIVHSDGTIN